MQTQQHDLRSRTKEFALRVLKLVSSLPRNREGDVLARQLLKAGTSIGANYREAQRASSKRHFITTLEISLREADETLYWLELLADSGMVAAGSITELQDECRQLVAILVSSVKTAKSNNQTEKAKNPK